MKDSYILLLLDCNHDCLFCSVPKKKTYLNKEDIQKKIDNHISEGAEQITLTGGEPTLHNDLLDIIRYVKSKNTSCRMISNGTSLTIELILKLIDAGLDYLALSVHTFDEEKAKKLAQFEKYDMKKIIMNIRYILEKTTLPLYLNITINKMNYKELPQMAHRISKHLKKVHMVNFNYVDIWGNVVEKNTVGTVGIQYYVAERYFIKAFEILKKNNILFRAERIPLCYLVGFEEYSSDFNRMTNQEKPTTDFVDKETQSFNTNDYIKSEQCKHCLYSTYCPGMSKNYARMYGTKELVPIFHEVPKQKQKNY
jgi:MoaA/NifB/PqqE/SkfB family radical SAM enzyme